MAEDGRVAVRNLRRDARKHLEASEKDGEISADELERAEKELEKITHDHVEAIDAALGRKEHRAARGLSGAGTLEARSCMSGEAIEQSDDKGEQVSERMSAGR